MKKKLGINILIYIVSIDKIIGLVLKKIIKGERVRGVYGIVMSKEMGSMDSATTCESVKKDGSIS